MKSYYYNGNLNEDIKNLDRKFDVGRFLKAVLKEILAMLIAYGLLLLIKFPPNIGPVACATYLTIRDAIKIKKECKKNSLKATRNLENLYSDINFDQSDMSLSMTKMKDCIAVENHEKVVENIESSIPVMSEEEKIINYFYLLDKKDQIRVLRQIKDEALVYLLEEEDIKRENIEIPVEKTLVLKK